MAAAAAELEPVAGDHDISITAAPGAEIEGVQDELHRLVLNLMENALRHTDPGTAVEASVERQNGHVVLAVEDDGPGIAPELREKVFERFFRAHGDRSGSSGLGLAIVKAVAESHHGSVTLEPPLDGRGARFVVRFPARCARTSHRPSSRGRYWPMAGGTCLTPLPSSSSSSSLGSEEYALPIGSVHEIIRFSEPRSVASDVPWIRGVIGLRGKIIPIYDLASRIGIDAGDAEFGKIVIVETGTGQAGVVVGDVEEVLTVTAEQLEAVPSADLQTIESIAKIGDRLVILLNPEGLFATAGADELAAA